MTDRAGHISGIALLVPLLAALLSSCRPTENARPAFSAQDSARILGDIAAHRAEVADFFRNHPNSPFVADPNAHFDSIKWFPPDLNFYFRLKLHRYDRMEDVIVYGSKGEVRHQRKFGWFEIPIGGTVFRLNVYKEAENAPPGVRDHLSVWFTDLTTNRETYGVGRYLEIGDENPDHDHLYVLDFNAAYNPYCAYSDEYSCAVPRKEDHIEAEIRAGEKKYHP